MGVEQCPTWAGPGSWKPLPCVQTPQDDDWANKELNFSALPMKQGFSEHLNFLTSDANESVKMGKEIYQKHVKDWTCEPMTGHQTSLVNMTTFGWFWTNSLTNMEEGSSEIWARDKWLGWPIWCLLKVAKHVLMRNHYSDLERERVNPIRGTGNATCPLQLLCWGCTAVMLDANVPLPCIKNHSWPRWHLLPIRDALTTGSSLARCVCVCVSRRDTFNKGPVIGPGPKSNKTFRALKLFHTWRQLTFTTLLELFPIVNAWDTNSLLEPEHRLQLR